jgi:hypothetical protein
MLEGTDIVLEIAIAGRACVGLLFVLAAVSKVRSAAAWRRFQESTASLSGDPRRRFTGWLSRSVVAAEFGVPVLVIGPATAVVGLALAGALTVGFTVAAFLARARGAAAACACFGGRSRPPWWSTALRNTFVVAAAGLGLPGSSATFSPATGLALAAGCAAAVLVVGLDHAVPTQQSLV